MEDLFHVPVLLEEVIQGLISEKTRIFVDATLGCGGHSYEILRRYKFVKIIGFEIDEEQMELARERLKPFSGRITILRENFRSIDVILRKIGIEEVDSVLFDLGVSSYQLSSKRGFSFYEDEFLDMRMDKRGVLTAFDIVNTYPLRKLKEIIEKYGEEKEASRIAKAIVEARRERKITTAKELAEIIIHAKRKKGKIHPATLTFQALRIAINEELDNLKAGLCRATDILKKGGRIGVISFHSLEDRIVKGFFKDEKSLRVLTKKPIVPKKKEILQNPRSRSAKLRIAEKI